MNPGRKLLVGVDEAGYGPNLGPLVVVAAWLEAPAGTSSESLWDRLAPVVNRYPAADAEAIVVDDSKRVYSAVGREDGLWRLERAALTWAGLAGTTPRTFYDFWTSCCLTPLGDIEESPWYAEQPLGLPRLVPNERLELDRPNLSCALARAGFASAGLACQVIMPRRFNELVRHGNKAAALFQVNAELLRHVWESSPSSQIEVILDKHGGRNFYGPLLQQEFMETLVLAGRESASASHYTVAARGRRLEATFVPEADARHFLVAAASMIAKYLRELCMDLFNAFWAGQVPGLRPTAGYPGDSRRFWKAIQMETDRLGIAHELLWRDR